VDHEQDAEALVRDIRLMLDEFDSTGSSEPLTDRVSDLIVGFNRWCDLAVRRLHDIHRLTDAECESCPKYVDGA
jgi:hypothetical protein